MRQRLQKLTRANDGAVMVEFTLIVMLLMLLTLGTVDFALALSQWNNASKAAQLGARLAAVADPVPGAAYVSGLTPPLTTTITVVCSGASSSCDHGTYDATAMNTIVYGRGKTSCSAVATDQLPAMCNILNGFVAVDLTPAKVKITYQFDTYASSGLAFAGRAGGPVPTITVELTGMQFNFFFLNGLLGLAPMTMPTMRTTITGEDLSSSGS